MFLTSLCCFSQTSGSGNVITVKLTLAAAPSSPAVYPADMKFDKKVGFIMVKDDQGVSDYQLYKYLSGGTTKDGITHPGVFYTDGCGNAPANLHSYKYSFAINGGTDNNSTLTNWNQKREIYAAGHGFMNHTYSHGGSDRYQEIKKLEKEVWTQIGTRMRTAVVPSADEGFVSAWIQEKYKLIGSTFGVEATRDGYDAYVNWGDRLHVNKMNTQYLLSSRTIFDYKWVPGISDFKNQINNFFDAAIDGNGNSVSKLMGHFFSHGPADSDMIYWREAMQYIKNHPKNKDQAWLPNAQEFAEYYETKENTAISNLSVSGNTVTFTLNQSNISDRNQVRDMSLLFSGGKIQSVSVSGADRFTYNSNTGLINIFKKNTAVSSPFNDPVPPQITTVKASGNKIQLVYDRNITQSGIEGYAVSGNSVVSLSGSGKTWYLTLKNNWATGQKFFYRMQKGNAADANNSTLKATSYIDHLITAAGSSFDIGLQQSVINFADLPNKTVGDAVFNLVATSNNTQTPITFISSNPAVVTVSNATGSWKATVVGVGTANITASQAGNSTYLAAANVVRTQVVQAAPIVKVQSVINFAALPTKTVGDAAFTLVATSNNTQMPITFTSSNSSIVSVSNASGSWKATIVGAGTANVTASQAGSTNFLAATNITQTQVVQAAPIVKQQSVISFNSLATKTVGDAAFNLVATSNNTQTPVTFTSSNSAVVSVSNASGSWKATIVGAGTANITASQAASTNYLAAANVTQTQVVQSAPVSAPTPTAKAIPGKVEAESYDDMDGDVWFEEEQGTENSRIMAGIDDEDWLDYQVNVATSGTYTFRFRVASTNASGRIQVKNAAGTVLSTVNVPNTGGWHDWQTISTTVALNAGQQTLRLYNAKGRWNINWLEATIANASATCTATGTILREQWNNISGSSVSAIPVNNTPNKTSQLTSFEAPTNTGNNYGSRIRGYICAPQSGNYTFFIAGDDDCELWLSTDDNSANKKKIAGFSGWTDPREWTKYESQKSATIYLEAGRRYYIEALHKEYGEGDNLAVAWQLPSGTLEAPIAGARLSPFVSSANQTMSRKPTDNTEVTLESKEAALTAYPNPFTSQATVQFTLAEASEAKLEVYNLQGKLVRTLFTGTAEAGVRKSFTLTDNQLTTGVYLIRLVTGTKVFTEKIVLE